MKSFREFALILVLAVPLVLVLVRRASRDREAVDAALAEQPDVLAKIRDGKVQAAGAVIGAVMKAMRGQADAARVRELVLERAAQ